MTKPKCKSCGSCGMPMEKPEDFARGDMNSDYCVYCTDKNGELFSYEKILEMNADCYIKSQGITKDAALVLAKDLLKSQPAWRNIHA